MSASSQLKKVDTEKYTYTQEYILHWLDFHLSNYSVKCLHKKSKGERGDKETGVIFNNQRSRV